MGRSAVPESWRIFRDKETGQIYCVEPTKEPSYGRKKKYELLGSLNEKKDAEQFCEYKKLGLSADAIAYLEMEHRLHDEFHGTENNIDAEQLYKMSEAVQEETGRPCFGKCRSMEHEAQACFLCYQNMQQTIWTQCATVKILLEMKKSASSAPKEEH